MNQQDLTRLARRLFDALQEVQQHVVQAVRGHALFGVVEADIFLQLEQRERTTGLHRRLDVVANQRRTTVTRPVVPDDLLAGFRNRERRTDGRVHQGFAIVSQLGAGGVFLGCIVDVLRIGRRTTRLVNRDLVRVVLLEYGLLAFAQIGRVLAHVRFGDLELRLVVRPRILESLAFRPVRIVVATIPCRDGPCGVAGLFGTQRGQFTPQLSRLFRRYLCVCIQ